MNRLIIKYPQQAELEKAYEKTCVQLKQLETIINYREQQKKACLQKQQDLTKQIQKWEAKNQGLLSVSYFERRKEE